ncbi:sugar ABC transporter permease [Paenibacillus sp. Soil766]|uniref:carbohydrate ABC transporter permease n=1 Tax=Paenibacillus sp. Soil766 TaxID=1736404 RepID=UPI00070F38E4|nr:sugar ABC transporter permease [Paenibacillus sp. Soil766]KRE98887.1 sugar ABC transporter permease [Paenibacillus sp. Soil766]
MNSTDANLTPTLQTGQPVSVRKRGKSRLASSGAWYAYLFISPMVLGYIIFLLIPIVAAFGMSFTNYSLLHDTEFVGLDNYEKAFLNDPLFWKTVWNTLYFSAGLIPLNLMLALGLALLLNRKIPGISLFRTAIFTPVVTSIVVWAIVWKYIFATDAGLVNQILQLFNIQGPAWLYNFGLAMPVVIVVSVLKNVGLNMVIFLAALQEVPKMYYEAAKIDGASRMRTFWNITFPMISPAFFLALILTLIGSLKVFSQIQVMTDGGPGISTYVLVYYIYQQAFKQFEFGYASSIAFILFFLVLILTIVQWNMRKRWVHHEQ